MVVNLVEDMDHDEGKKAIILECNYSKPPLRDIVPFTTLFQSNAVPRVCENRPDLSDTLSFTILFFKKVGMSPTAAHQVLL